MQFLVSPLERAVLSSSGDRGSRFSDLIKELYIKGFGEASPEAKGAKNLHNFFTYIAVGIVTAQLQSYNPEAYEELMEFLGTHSLNDGDKFCADLMRESLRHKSLALRILEVRSAYCKNDFEWDNLKRLGFPFCYTSNNKLRPGYSLEKLFLHEVHAFDN
ncbi:hypothetical protein HYC85_017669 [Camellia sinensis]|uniref:Uncharacterized protein n=1 Tax=Camellia sinensis TaxID=4442 RepID=A0A7J7GS27_CAMSI|nr:hypothetical protein HYC85_017669 [Camellia sinensis]